MRETSTYFLKAVRVIAFITNVGAVKVYKNILRALL
jgi:hypothetical protein